MKFKSFRCGECGAAVRLVAKPGRVHEYRRGVLLPVPADFKIPTCPECGEEYLSVERGDALEALQRPAFAALQKAHLAKVVERLKELHGVTLRQIESACGVTGTYLSHVLAGRKEASATLVYLLEAYALSPAEFHRRQSGGTWTEALRTALPSPTYAEGRTVPSAEREPSELPAILPPLMATPYAAPKIPLGLAANDREAA